MNFIFLPGASGNTEFWQPLMDLLPEQDGKTVIAYPSFGGYGDHADVNNFLDLQRYVLDQISQPSVIVAQSMGGIFAVQAALQKPDLVDALVLVATSGGVDLSSFNVADWRQDYQQTFDVPDWFVQPQVYLDNLLYKIECPVLLIWGDADPISPVAIGQYLHGKIILSELHVIQQGQHDLAQLHADQVAFLLQAFIEKIMSIEE